MFRNIITHIVVILLVIVIIILPTSNIYNTDAQSVFLMIFTFWYIALNVSTKNKNRSIVARFLIVSLKVMSVLLTISGFVIIPEYCPQNQLASAYALSFCLILITTLIKYRQAVICFFMERRILGRIGSSIRNLFATKMTNNKSPNTIIQNENEQEDLYDLDPYEYEEAVAEYLRDNGYFEVDTTPRSGDFGADVIASSPNGKKVCVQCKRYGENNKVGVKAVQEIYSARKYYNCEKAYIFTTSSYTEQAKEMAEKLGVILLEYR